MFQVLFASNWDEILRLVAWEDDHGVMTQVLGNDGSTFLRRSSCSSLAELWRTESSYVFFTPAVTTLEIAVLLLGSPVHVLDHVQAGPLQPAPRSLQP